MHDANGVELHVGDRVFIPAIIKTLHGFEDYCNVSVESQLGRRPDGLKENLGSINTAVLLKCIDIPVVQTLEIKTGPDSPSPILRFFSFEHLPLELRPVAELLRDAARKLDELLPNSAEKSAGLRKLLEAKDCMVRAALVD